MTFEVHYNKEPDLNPVTYPCVFTIPAYGIQISDNNEEKDIIQGSTFLTAEYLFTLAPKLQWQFKNLVDQDWCIEETRRDRVLRVYHRVERANQVMIEKMPGFKRKHLFEKTERQKIQESPMSEID
jgi:D-hexose-6-phosphate mutarotase